MKVYIVEDDANIRNLVAYTLNASGFEAKGFEDASPFYAVLKKEKPDLVLLDIMLPKEDGLAILKKIRENPDTRRLPVIMLTAKDGEYDKVLGLDGGADDYITKPFGMLEMVARVKAVMRRAYPQNDAEICYSIGPVSLFPKQREVYVDDTVVALTMKEFDLLRTLMETPGVVFSRDKLMERIWDYSYEGDTRTVDVHVRLLRQKLGSGGDIIETVRGVGYKVVDKK